MADPMHPVNPDWVLFDPTEHSPPKGVNLLLINEGGTLIVGPWYDGARAWGYKPRIPSSVKARQLQRLQKQKEESESFHACQSESGQADPA